MDDFDIIFDPPPPPPLLPPPEDLTFAPPRPGTIFYLSESDPAADAWTWRGPFASFDGLVGVVADVVASSHPSSNTMAAGAKTKTKKNPKTEGKAPDVEKGKEKRDWRAGFTRLVVSSTDDAKEKGKGKGEGAFKVLEVIREVNPTAYASVEEGKPVFTVVRAGPMAHAIDPYTRAVSKKQSGRATTSRIVGTFTTPTAARSAARSAMQEMLADEEPAPEAKEAFPVEGAGGGLIMAFSPRARYEVRVCFETDGLVGALGVGRPRFG